MLRDQERFGFRNKPKYLRRKDSFDFRVGDLIRRNKGVEIRLRTMRKQHVFRIMSIYLTEDILRGAKRNFYEVES